MPLDPAALAALRLDDIVHDWSARDSLVYALGVGCGGEADDLPFVLGPAPHVLPTMAVVLGSPGFWLQHVDIGVDWRRILHGEQSIEIERPIPAAGRFRGRLAIEQLVDQGEGRHALMRCRRDLVDEADGQRIATLRESWVLRGGGGFGGDRTPLPPPAPMPAMAPDIEADIAIDGRSALLYRLSGDMNPLHADPAVARAAGFGRPILHGLCTMGIVGRAILKLCCGNDPDRLRGMGQRFSAPVYPGEGLRLSIWTDGSRIAFRATVPARDVVILDHGWARRDDG